MSAESPSMIEYWPGTDIPKSLHNGFTLGYTGRPHGYAPGPAKPTAVKSCARQPGGFARNSGTILGMGPKPNQAFRIKARA
jgi:hypothetical protein